MCARPRGRAFRATAGTYQARPYDGPITLFMLEHRSAMTDSLFDPMLGRVDPYLGWKRFAAGGWNLLNLFIIVLALAGFATASPIFYSAPALRIIRGTRLLTESGRSSAEQSR